MSDFIAFYGTLTSGHSTPMDKLIQQHLTYVGNCLVPGKLYRKARYPALKTGLGRVKAELYKIDSITALEKLDAYEATDNEDPSLPGFSRRLMQLLDPELVAWIYYYDGSVEAAELIESGSWK